MRSFHRIFTASLIDVVNAIRNRMVVYVLIAPILMALGMRLLLPTLSEVRLSLLVDPTVPEDAVTELSRYADVRRVEGPEALLDLVSREDEALGVTAADRLLTVVAFGDEHAAMLEMAQGAVYQAQRVLDGDPPPALQLEIYESPGNVLEGWRQVVLAVLALFGATVGMFAIAFGLMEDKVGRTLSALGVSPLTRSEYLAAKSLAGGVFVVVVALATLWVGGADAAWAKALVVAVASVPVAVGVGLMLGIASSSDVQLVTYVKAVSLIFMVPIVAKLLPAAWQATLWWVPTYWLGRGFVGASAGSTWRALLVDAALAAALGLVLVVAARVRVGRSLAGA